MISKEDSAKLKLLVGDSIYTTHQYAHAQGTAEQLMQWMRLMDNATDELFKFIEEITE